MRPRLSKAKPYLLLAGLAAYPILQLLAANLGELPAAAALRPMAISVAAALSLGLALRMVTGSWPRACMITAALIVLFFSYGHVYSQVKGMEIGGVLLGRHRYLVITLLLLFLAWTALIVTADEFAGNAYRALPVVLIVLLAMPLAPILRRTVSRSASVEHAGAQEASSSNAQAVGASDDLPDIYYIIVDAFGSQQVLDDLYDVDISPFLDTLRERGFYVATEATSNYSVTTLSLASSLNMTYLDDVAEREGPNSKDHQPLAEMIAHSRVTATLRDYGYQFVAFDTGYERTTIEDSDVFLQQPPLPGEGGSRLSAFAHLNPVEGLVLETSALRLLVDFRSVIGATVLETAIDEPYAEHRQRVTYELGQLPEIARREGPQFVFVHIISPHPPFVFDAEGRPVNPDHPFTLRDHNCCTQQEYVVGYRNQVEYLTARLAEAIQEILSNSEIEPIIVIQGDHGPAAHWSPSVEEANIEERMSILDVYLAPAAVRALLYPQISPVNSFRVILHGLLRLPFEKLPDRNYFSADGYPYRLREVTGDLDLAVRRTKP